MKQHVDGANVHHHTLLDAVEDGAELGTGRAHLREKETKKKISLTRHSIDY